eukprot:m.10332 g.10332  ORF g.10332 m.10332 type:complete len:1658 (+) comp5548_c0_seq1:208-5181(+)
MMSSAQVDMEDKADSEPVMSSAEARKARLAARRQRVLELKKARESMRQGEGGSRQRSGSTASMMSRLSVITHGASHGVHSQQQHHGLSVAESDTRVSPTLSRRYRDNDSHHASFGGGNSAMAEAREAALKAEIDSLKRQVAEMQAGKGGAYTNGSSSGSGGGADTAMHLELLQAKDEQIRSITLQHSEAMERIDDLKSELAASKKALEDTIQSPNSGATSTVTDDSAGETERHDVLGDAADDVTEKITPSGAVQADGDGDDKQAILEHFRAQFEEKMRSLLKEVQHEREQREKAEELLEQKQSEWHQIAEAMQLAADKAGHPSGDFDIGAMLEDMELCQEENEELQALLQETAGQIESMQLELKRAEETRVYLDTTLNDVEEDNRNLLKDIEDMKAAQRRASSLEASSEQLKEELQEVHAEADTLKVKLQTALADLREAQQLVKDQEAQIKEHSALRAELGQHVDELTAELADEKAKVNKTNDELHDTMEELSEARETALQIKQQCEEKEKAAEATIQEARRAAMAEVETALASREEQQQQITEMKRELKLAQHEAQEVHAQMEEVVASVQAELAQSKGNLHDAAVAGLSLSDLVNQLKADKLDAEQQQERLQEQMEAIQAKLDEREALLTQVMEHLQQQAGIQPGSDENPVDALSRQLEKARSEHERMLDTMRQYESDIQGLEDELARVRSDLMAMKAARDKALAELSHEKEACEIANGELAEKEGMLHKVMQFLKGKKIGDSDDDDDLEREQLLGDGTGGARGAGGDLLARLDAELAAAAEARLELEQQLKDATAQISALEAELAAFKQALGDEEQEKNALSKANAALDTKCERLEGKCTELVEERDSLTETLAKSRKLCSDTEAQLKDKQAELDRLLQELQATDENMKRAAAAGLTLTEMLNQLKEQHASQVAELELEIHRLKKQIAAYEAQLASMRECLGDGDDGEDGDLVARLKRALDAAVNTQRDLENEVQSLLEQLELAKQERVELVALRDGLRKEKERLEETIEELEARVRELEEQLAASRDRLAKASDMLYDGNSGGEASDDDARAPLDFDGLLAELEKKIELIAELKEQVTAMQAQIDALTEQVESLSDELVDAKDEIKAGQSEISLLSNKLLKVQRKLEDTVEERDALKEQLDEALEREAALKGVIAEQTELIERLKQRVAELEAILEARGEVDAEELRELLTLLADKEKRINDLERLLKKQRDLFRRRYLKKWETNTKYCFGCDLEFTLFNRRHHCRLCGEVFCDACCRDRVKISAQRRPARACRDCFDFMTEIELEELDHLDEQEIIDIVLKVPPIPDHEMSTQQQQQQPAVQSTTASTQEGLAEVPGATIGGPDDAGGVLSPAEEPQGEDQGEGEGGKDQDQASMTPTSEGEGEVELNGAPGLSLEFSTQSLGGVLSLEVFVHRVAPGGPAALAGLKVNHKLVKINGVEVSGMSRKRVNNILFSIGEVKLSVVAMTEKEQEMTISDRLMARQTRAASMSVKPGEVTPRVWSTRKTTARSSLANAPDVEPKVPLAKKMSIRAGVRLPSAPQRSSSSPSSATPIGSRAQAVPKLAASPSTPQHVGDGAYSDSSASPTPVALLQRVHVSKRGSEDGFSAPPSHTGSNANTPLSSQASSPATRRTRRATQPKKPQPRPPSNLFDDSD